MKKIAVALAIVILPMVLGGVIYGFASLYQPEFIWGWMWFGLFAWFFYSKQDTGSRGWIFLSTSLILAVGGKAFLTKQNPCIDKDVIDMFYQLMLIAGGSIGANFVSQALLEKSRK